MKLGLMERGLWAYDQYLCSDPSSIVAIIWWLVTQRSTLNGYHAQVRVNPEDSSTLTLRKTWQDPEASHKKVNFKHAFSCVGVFLVYSILFSFSHLWASEEEMKRLACSWSLDFIPLCYVSINQRFTIKVKHQWSTPSPVVKYELINFLLICMIIKSLALESRRCPPTRSLIRLS